MNVTAVVLSADDVAPFVPGLQVLVHRSVIRDAAEHQRARFDAARRVETSHFFYLDDDDTLPTDYLDVIGECVAAGGALAYTDELQQHPDGSTSVRRSSPYSRDAHLNDPLLVHHLALYRTADAQRAIEALPVGHYYPEFMLSWAVASAGAAYVPRIGYHWYVSGHGLHTLPAISASTTRAMLWCRDNL